MSVRIIYQDIAAGADEDAAVTTESAQEFSNPDLLPFEDAAPSLASLEPNRWILDGTREIVDGQPVPFWSEAMSGEDGRFETPPVIDVDFDARYTSPGIFLHFAPESWEYCPEVVIQWRRGPSLLAEERFYPDGPDFFCEKTVEAYDHVSIQLLSTNIPYRYAKLSYIVFGLARIFLRDEIRNARVTAETDVLSSEIAVNTLDFALDSETDVDYMFQLKQPVYAYDSDSLIGVFYIDKSTHRAAGLYDISCVDAVGVLDEDPFPAAMYSARPARSLLEEILGGHFELKLDTALAAVPVTGYFPGGSRRDALQQVAFAIGAVVDTSGTEAVRVYMDRENTPGRFPADRVYTGGTVETDAIVTAVQVTAHAYSTTGSGNDTVEVDGTTYYHTVSVTTIENPKATASDKQNVIAVDQATLVNPGNVAAVAQRVFDYYSKRDRQNIKIVMDGERPGDRIAAPTPWGSFVNGYITRMNIVLSGIAAADCEVVGTEVKVAGDPEARYSGEFFAGEL